MGGGEVSDSTCLYRNYVPVLTTPQRTNAAGIVVTDKSCLIMDEVDGMSAGDRGGVGALAALIRKTKVHFLSF